MIIYVCVYNDYIEFLWVCRIFRVIFLLPVPHRPCVCKLQGLVNDVLAQQHAGRLRRFPPGNWGWWTRCWHGSYEKYHQWLVKIDGHMMLYGCNMLQILLYYLVDWRLLYIHFCYNLVHIHRIPFKIKAHPSTPTHSYIHQYLEKSMESWWSMNPSIWWV